MADLTVLCARALEAVEGIQERLSAKQWAELSRTAFVYNTTQTINALLDLSVIFEEIEQETQREAIPIQTDVKGHLSEIKELLKVLERNQSLEATRIQKGAEKGLEFLTHEIENPDNYSHLEQKVFGIVLRGRYLIERINLQAKKHENTPFTGTKTTKHVLDLLSEKESEIFALKEKYEELRNKGQIASLADQTPSDIEQELQSYSRQLHAHSQTLNEAFDVHKKKLSDFELTQRHLEQKIHILDELQQRHYDKTIELVTALKKERDYAKKIVLDIEGETLSLRNAYMNKILNIEKEKAQTKSEAYEQFRKKLSSLENEVKDKTELISHLRKTHIEHQEKMKKMQEPKEKEKKSG